VPVQDIGAFAPRDYTKVKAVPAAEVHNYHASDHIPKTCEPPFPALHFAAPRFLLFTLQMLTARRRYYKEGWYARVENNNWRSIAFNMLPKAADLDKEQAKASEKGREWHYNRLQRWQDREKKQRNRRIEWMQKLYVVPFPHRIFVTLAQLPAGAVGKRCSSRRHIAARRSSRVAANPANRSTGNRGTVQEPAVRPQSADAGFCTGFWGRLAVDRMADASQDACGRCGATRPAFAMISRNTRVDCSGRPDRRQRHEAGLRVVVRETVHSGRRRNRHCV
jgi:hypothetical protein